MDRSPFEGRSHGLDLVLAAVDVSLERTKVGLAVLQLALAAGSGFVVLLLSSIVGEPALAAVLFAAWAISMWVLGALVLGTIARLAHVALSGEGGTTLGDAVEYARRHIAAFAVAPLLPLVLAALAVGVEWLLLHVSRIPDVGEILAAVLFLPLVLLNMGILVGVVVGTWLVPAAIAGEGRGTTDTLRAVYRTLASAPGRVLLHFVAALAAMVVVAALLGGLLWLAVTQTLALGGLAGGQAAQAGGIVGMLAELGLAGFPEVGEPDVLTAATLLVYVLYAAMLGSFVAMVPLYVFPLCAACAAWIDAGATRPSEPSGSAR